MSFVHGRLVIAYLDNPILCGTDAVFSEEKEMIPASTVTSNGWQEYRPRKRSWKIDVTGFTKVDNTDGQEDYFDMIGSGTMDAKSITLVFTDEEGNSITIEGPEAYISDSSISGNVNEFANASLTFLGNGAYDLTGS
jgi:hypothetical protein